MFPRQRHVMLLLISTILALGLSTSASAHPHVAENAKGGKGQIVANGQNHPDFIEQENGIGLSCAGVSEPEDTGPAGYGLETAHHGPDKGAPGKADGCFLTDYPTQDNNPGLN